MSATEATVSRDGFTPGPEHAQTIVSPPRAEHHDVALGIGESEPRLSWRVKTEQPGWYQHAYEIEALDDLRTAIWSSGQIVSDESVLVPWPGPALGSRGRVLVRVRVWAEEGAEPSGWSEPTPIEAGLLDQEEWQASFVTATTTPSGSGAVAADDEPPVLLRREFAAGEDIVRARVYATACGVYELELNGRRIGDDVLAPGWTSYQHRLLYQTYDITHLVRTGTNAIGAHVSNGWYRGELAWNRLGERYGSRTALLLQLELTYADGRRESVITDDTWTWASSPITRTSLYDGEHHDARNERPGWSSPGLASSQDWHQVNTLTIEAAGVGRLTAPIGPPVRRIESIAPITIEHLDDGTHLLDFGQNLVGRLRLEVDGPAGTVIGLRHAEVVQDGRIYTRPIRTAAAHDEYVLGGQGRRSWEPRFTYHGFRYAEITGWPGELRAEDIVAVVCHDDMKRTGWFSSSEPLLDRLHDNVVWSMRGNFVSVPTDCPQRDERLGWTGDLQVFAPTAAFLFDSAGSVAEWMKDVAAETGEDGLVPLYVPHVETSFPQFHNAVWGDVTTVVPLVLHERTGDLTPVRDGYESAKAWVEGCRRLLDEHDVISSGPQLGDWLDPAAPPDRPQDARTDAYLVATAYLAYSARLLAKQAELLSKPDEAAEYTALAGRVTTGFRREFITASGRCASDAPAAYALALRFDLFEPQQRSHAGERLRQLVRAAEHRIGTGFAGTPLILDALSDAGDLESAYRLLLEQGCPSWLYPITMGATTIWERWDSMLPDGTVNPGEMTSFNHYALGAVADWMQRILGGLAPGAPGYRVLEVRPRPGGGLTHAHVAHETPYGTASVNWRREGERLQVDVTVPPNSSARVTLPGQDTQTVPAGRHSFVTQYQAPEDDPVAPLPPLPRF